MLLVLVRFRTCVGLYLAFWMLSKSRLPSRMADTIEAKLSSVRTMSAASLLTSLPFRPMATPTSAPFNAGESLTPSPVMTQYFPRRCKVSNIRSLVVGLQRATTSGRGSSSSSWSSDILSNSGAVMTAVGEFEPAT